MSGPHEVTVTALDARDVVRNLLREYEVTPRDPEVRRRWVKANTHGEAAVRWAEGEDARIPNDPLCSVSLFTRVIEISVAEVLDGGNARGPAKRFRLQTRFTRTYDVVESK